MTNYRNIQEARNRFRDFNWPACAIRFGAEFANYAAAERPVGDNPFYGYNRDLGAAKSTLYPNLSYTAWALLTRVGGERSLNDFQGTNRNTPHAAYIDTLIRNYEAEINAPERNEVGPQHRGIANRFLVEPVGNAPIVG